MTAAPLRISTPLRRDRLPVTDCSMANWLVGVLGEVFAETVAWAPNAEARTSAIARRKKVESDRLCFILLADFLATQLN